MMLWRRQLHSHQCAAGRWTGTIRVAGLKGAPMGVKKLAIKQGMMRAQEELAATARYSDWQQSIFKKEIPQ
jgi:hypothetical protein